MFIKYSIFNHVEKNFDDLKTPNYSGNLKTIFFFFVNSNEFAINFMKFTLNA
jgi:hypothetical protein